MRVVVLAVVAVAVVGAGAFWVLDRGGDGRESERMANPLARFYDQQIEWTSCGDNECGDLEVPLDYEDVGGDTIEIALEKVPATGDRLGSLAVNPGGPGNSGTAFVRSAVSSFSPALLERYDVVGFDPRGVGRSSPIDCLVDSDRAEERFRVPGYSGKFWRKCEQRSGEILGHASTAEVARDLDILRGALGEDHLDYLGFSYGTQLGATYAELFPDRVGRFVLDGAVDANRSRIEETVDEVTALQRGLEDFLRDCIARSCPIGDTVQDGVDRVGRLLRESRRLPLQTARGLPLGDQAAAEGISTALSDPVLWQRLENALAAAIIDRNGTGLASLAELGDEGTARSEPGHDAGDEARVVIRCLDDPWFVPLQLSGAYYRLLVRASRVFGWYYVGALAQCDGIPFRQVPVALEFDAAGAAPIVVIGTTGDLVTPYDWAVAMAGELSSGVLVTREGHGHTAYRVGNPCIDDLVDAFFVEGTVPADGTRC